MNRTARLNSRDALALLAPWCGVCLLFWKALDPGEFWWTDNSRHATNDVFFFDLWQDMPWKRPMSIHSSVFCAVIESRDVVDVPEFKLLVKAVDDHRFKMIKEIPSLTNFPEFDNLSIRISATWIKKTGRRSCYSSSAYGHGSQIEASAEQVSMNEPFSPEYAPRLPNSDSMARKSQSQSQSRKPTVMRDMVLSNLISVHRPDVIGNLNVFADLP